MSRSKQAAEIAALRQIALEDIARASETDLREQAREEALDFNGFAEQVRSSMREAAAGVLREQLAAKRSAAVVGKVTAASLRQRPTLDRIKAAIQEVFAREPDLKLAFRSGSKQSDGDWESLYDDLVSMGALKPDDGDSR
ncbi:MAG: hypothetical protein KF720_14425 [Rubrivivax sp.]|nr:hypothetical protein [Rubrivivax sp.]